MIKRIAVLLVLGLAVISCSQTESPNPSGFDLVIANGEIYDGLGGDPGGCYCAGNNAILPGQHNTGV